MNGRYQPVCSLHKAIDRSFDKAANTKKLLSQIKAHVDQIRDARQRGEDPRLIPHPAGARASVAEDGSVGLLAEQDG